MASWDAVGAHLTERLATFRGERALFIHNALYYWGVGVHGRGRSRQPTSTSSSPTCVAAIALGDHFLRAARPAVDAGVDVGPGADVVGVGPDRVPGLRDLRGGEGRDRAMGAARAGRARATAARVRGSSPSARASSTRRRRVVKPSSRPTPTPVSPASPRPCGPGTCSPPTNPPT